MLATGKQQHPGGKGLNQAVAAVRAGVATWFIGLLGQDAAGDLLQASMRDASIDTSALEGVDTPSGSAVIVVQDSGENTIVVDAEANGAPARTLVPAGTAVRGAAVPARAPGGRVVAEAATLARQAGTTVVLNASPAAPFDRRVLSSVDVIVVNEHEALALDSGPDHVPGVAATVRDTTGAGDTAGTESAHSCYPRWLDWPFVAGRREPRRPFGTGPARTERIPGSRCRRRAATPPCACLHVYGVHYLTRRRCPHPGTACSKGRDIGD